MAQRTALEQDTIDFAESIIYIFEKQLELQRELMELLHAIRERNVTLDRELELTSLEVNPLFLHEFENSNLQKPRSGGNNGADLSI